MTHHPRIRRDAVLALALPLACVAAPQAAFGQAAAPAAEDPYYIGATVGFLHDSNVYRRPNNEASDTIWNTGVVGGFNLRLGRQRVFADADAQVHRYQNVPGLNNKSFAVRSGLDWETVETLAGTLHYDARDSLESFSLPDGSTFLSDQRTQQLSATARYGLVSQVMLDLGYTHRVLEVASAGGRDVKQDTVSTGLRWAAGSKLTLGAGVRVTQGKQQTTPAVDETKRRDIDLTATYATGSFSTFNARVSATKETHSLSSSADLSEATGTLSWSYRPTGKLTFNTSATRDTGTETTFTAAAAGDSGNGQPTDNARLSNTLSADVQYAFTGKISLSGNVRHRKGTLSNSQSEAVTGYGMGLSYQPTRSLALRCSVSREDRTVAGANAYKATLTGCTGEVTLR